MGSNFLHSAAPDLALKSVPDFQWVGEVFFHGVSELIV